MASLPPQHIVPQLHDHNIGSKRKPDNVTDFQRMLETIYILLRLDQIRESGGYSISGVNTFYRLLDYPEQLVTPVLKREGGITASCFIVLGLRNFWSHSRIEDQPFYMELLRYFEDRQTPESGGLGIKQPDRLTEERIDATLRHTAQVVATLLCFRSPRTERIVKKALPFVLSFNSDRVKDSLLNDSWPVGAISSYIRSMDQIYRSVGYLSDWPEMRSGLSPILRWPRERHRWVKKLADIDDMDVQRVQFYPDWPTVKGSRKLWLHSLATVVRQVPDICTAGETADRVLGTFEKSISHASDGYVLASHRQAADLSSSIALWSLLNFRAVRSLEKARGRNWEYVRSSLLNFILSNYKNPVVFSEFWAETAVLCLNHACDTSLYSDDEKRVRLEMVELEINEYREKGSFRADSEYNYLNEIISSVDAKAMLTLCASPRVPLHPVHPHVDPTSSPGSEGMISRAE
jgi:hypothetical protein